jgi:hypothetical protein
MWLTGRRRLGLVILAVTLFITAGCVGFGGEGAGDRRPSGQGGPGASSSGGADGPVVENPPPGLDVTAENALPGSRGWRIPKKRVADDDELSAFADRISVLPGESFRLFVSTSAPRFRVTAYRMGWYGGAEARGVWESGQVAGRAQGAAQVSPGTRTVSARWDPSVVASTVGWPEGMYLLRLDSSAGKARYVPLVVRSRSARDRVVLMHAVNTWQAYNEWGGYSLYGGPDGFGSRSYAVSFDRPYDGNGAEKYFFFEDAIVHRAERLGLPLAYITNVELGRDRHLLHGARGLVSLGHDEYWTADMKRNAEAARDRGVNLAFLGANALYWRVRYAETALGRDRLLIGYKSASLDPIRAEDPRNTTAKFRDEPAADPEDTIVGQLYDCFPASPAGYTVQDPTFFLFTDTGARRGSSYPGVVGIETDRAQARDSTPRPLQVVAKSRTDCSGEKTWSTSVYYTVESGAGVFSTGTMLWVYATRGTNQKRGIDQKATNFTRQVTDNLLQEMSHGPMGRRHPARDNLNEVGLGNRASP